MVFLSILGFKGQVLMAFLLCVNKKGKSLEGEEAPWEGLWEAEKISEDIAS
jgi:hypothetical protein